MLCSFVLTGPCILSLGCHPNHQVTKPKPAPTSRATPNSIPVIHVIVALCDNKYQGIIPVPARIGNGDIPEENLYWGCDLGVKTYFRHSKDWKLEKTIQNPTPIVLERLIFSNRKQKAVLVADAYRGREIKRATEDFLTFASGAKPESLEWPNKHLTLSGGADFLVYVGHDGLMNFQVPTPPTSYGQAKKVAVLCCKSQEFFGPSLKAANAQPLLWTKSLMAPEAYVAEAAIQSYFKKESGTQATERAAKAYAKYQKISIRSARTVFTSGF